MALSVQKNATDTRQRGSDVLPIQICQKTVLDVYQDLTRAHADLYDVLVSTKILTVVLCVRGFRFLYSSLKSQVRAFPNPDKVK